jgi:D-glycero-D-manno-heptose 1,7-bisphosphate phosphatase
VPGDRVLFLDRDGVINEHVWPAPRSWAQFRFYAGVPETLAEATREGWRIVVATNKGAVGARFISRRVSDEINARMVEELARVGARVERVFACNHFPHGLCHCRKPKPGMLLDAERELGLRRGVWWMVGDNATDVAAGAAAGCKTVVLTTVHPRITLEAKLKRLGAVPDAWASDLPEAWQNVIRASGH